MSKTVEANLIDKEIMKALMNYQDDISEVVEKVANKVGKEAVDELKQTSPKRSKKRILQRVEIKKRQIG